MLNDSGHTVPCAADEREYILVSDKNSKVLKSSTDYQEIKKLANLIRSAGGEVTIFKEVK